jgi:hypothetical protein
MMGAFNYTAFPNYETSNSLLTDLHVFASNIFLINYLIAILSTAYDMMIDNGEFTYKCNLYEYIEKYSIAMIDDYGYSELVLHPPPMNILSVFIWPAAFVPSFMKQAAVAFSKMMFWLENMVYIIIFIFSEVVLFPVVYIKLAIQITIQSTFLSLIPMLALWILSGPLVLIYHLGHDVFYLIKLLCDYMDEHDEYKEKEETDFRHDKIVIYNEVLEIMRTVAYLYRQKLYQAREARLAKGETLEGIEMAEQALF